MRNKKAEALGLTTLLVAVIAGGIILGKAIQVFPLAWGISVEETAGLSNQLQTLLFGTAIALVIAWFAVSAVLEGQRSLKAELEQQRAEVSALRLAITDLRGASPEPAALPRTGEPEIEYR